MSPRSLDFFASAGAGDLWRGSGETAIHRVTTDSRDVMPKDLFIALEGDKFDGHTFLAEAARKGAAAVLVAKSKATLAANLPPSVGVVTVDNTRQALGRIATQYRQAFTAPIIAVGGSNGKTTTKELIASVLRQKFQVLSSEASFNNDIGVPVTLLKLKTIHQAAVLEVGTNHPGELAPLLGMIQPKYGVITSIGREHLEYFGDVAGVAQEEGAIAEVLPSEGKLFLHGDSEWTPSITRRTQAPTVTVGLGDHNTWRAKDFWVGEEQTRFVAEAPRPEYSGEYQLRLVGRHQVPNALLALAVGMELGVTPEEGRRGLAKCAPPKMRLQVYEANGARILDDAYNANTDSMLAALQTLRDLPCRGRRVAVLGNMAELGPHTIAAHREVGRRVAELRIDRLIAVGQWAQETADAARAAGHTDAQIVADVPTLATRIRALLDPGDVALFKASRSVGLERVTAALRGEPKQPH